MPSSRRLGTIAVFAWSVASLATAATEVLVLLNGREIEVERYWEEGEQIFYEKNGNLFGFPRTLLERVDRSGEDDVAGDEAEPRTRYVNEIAAATLADARRANRDGDTAEAIRAYRETIRKAPDQIQAPLELSDIYFKINDFDAARRVLEQAKRVSPENTRIRDRLGDVYFRLGQTGFAIREWQIALAQEPSPGLLYKLRKALRDNDDDIVFEESRRANFVIRYDGRVNETIGRIVANALDNEYADLKREFRFAPSGPIEVTLYTNRQFQDVTHAPSWASGLNDGQILIPVEGISEMTPRLRRVVRHELTHSFVTGITNGNCPTWFHEGLAQIAEGSERPSPYPRLQKARAEGQLVPLWSLEGNLIDLSKDKALLVYAEALAATEYLQARRGREALMQILQLLAQKQTMNAALKSVVGLDYEQFQLAWEADLARYRPGVP